MEKMVNSRRKVGSRRYRYAVEKGLDPYPASVRKDRLHEVILEVICDGQGDPDHGEQVLVCDCCCCAKQLCWADLVA